MQVAVFSTQKFERDLLLQASREGVADLHFFEVSLNESTASLAAGFPVVSVFANDQLNASVIATLQAGGTRLVALRSAGFNHVDLAAAKEAQIRVVRVPAYSPYSVAEHAVAMLLSLNRKIHRAYNRVREGNFSLDGLLGFDLHGKTVGVVGTGRIGAAFLSIMRGFGCHLLAYDIHPDSSLEKELGVRYVSLEELCRESDVISLHLPLRENTRHLIGENLFRLFKPGAILINTGRGALIDTKALIGRLKEGSIGACLDVYEEEESLYFKDHSSEVLRDDVLARLLTFSNVLVTAHQGFLTREAIKNISDTTLANIQEFAEGGILTNEVKMPVNERKK